MALWSTSFLNAPPLPPMADGVEFYVVESETVLSPAATPFAKPAAPFRALTVLINFSKSDADRTALRPLLDALAFGQASSAVCHSAEWHRKLPKRLSERLKLAGHYFVAAVIYAGSSGDSDAETVQTAVDSLQQCFKAVLAALLVVADTSSHQLSRVAGVSGFVVGASGTNAGPARSVFLCLAMFMAPKTMNGIDLADLHPTLGTATEPTVLAESMWLRDGEGRLVLASPADAQAVRCAAHVVAFPLVDGRWNWSELGRICRAIHAAASEAGTKVPFRRRWSYCIGPAVLSDQHRSDPVRLAIDQRAKLTTIRDTTCTSSLRRLRPNSGLMLFSGRLCTLGKGSANDHVKPVP